ncbi:MAG: amidohydrolase family protein [Betaproteobacteria bacterium]|nr:amidohydrolase family protein [Betaproteobacteria bacterium]MCC6247295.1 amidohydrolase family protein [Rubrivivax sp.]
MHRHPASRRTFLGCCGSVAAGLFTGLGLGASSSAHAASPWATACLPALPGAANEVLQRALQGLVADQLWDMHCHLLGNGDSGSGCYLHPSLTSGFHLVERARRRVILEASCVDPDGTSIDAAYVQRLRALAEAFPPGARWLLFAFEQAHDAAGAARPEHTTVHVPDRYAAAVAAAAPHRFGWVASIHPYRADALPALREARRAGAVAVKWLPSSMNIDLREPRSLVFGEAATALGLPLIVHCGEEKAVPGARREDLVNPLHVRALLERGVRVVVAHCASLGQAADLDRTSAPEVPAFDLFARLMDERAFEGRLFGDIAAVFQRNRTPTVWRAIIERQHAGRWAGRLLHGSDYPLPGLKWLTSLPKLRSAGLLAAADEAPLARLREHDPLLFDLALKRSLKVGAARLGDEVFATRRHFVA